MVLIYCLATSSYRYMWHPLESITTAIKQHSEEWVEVMERGDRVGQILPTTRNCLRARPVKPNNTPHSHHGPGLTFNEAKESVNNTRSSHRFCACKQTVNLINPWIVTYTTTRVTIHTGKLPYIDTYRLAYF